MQAGRAKFVANSGDVAWWGNQGRSVSDSPYWKRVNDTMLKLLPAPESPQTTKEKPEFVCCAAAFLTATTEDTIGSMARPESRPLLFKPRS